MKNFKAVSMDCNQEQFESIKEELIELGCKIEEDKKSGWYAHQDTKYLMFHDFEKGEKFGFCTIGDWYKGVGMIDSCYLIEDFMKLDNKEVLKRLTEEAKKRGYLEKDLKINIDGKEYLLEKEKGTFQVAGNLFLYQGATIMKDGKWADIIKKEEPKADSFDVEKDQDKKLDSMTKSRNQYKYLYEKEKKLNKEYINNMIAIRGAVDEKEYEINRLKNDIDALKDYNKTYYNTYKRRLDVLNDRISDLSKHNKELLFKKDRLEKEIEESIKETNTYKLAALILTIITSIFIISKLLF